MTKTINTLMNTSCLPRMTKNAKHRWAVYSKASYRKNGTVNPIGSFQTRSVARLNKTPTQGIFDTFNFKFVR